MCDKTQVSQTFISAFKFDTDYFLARCYFATVFLRFSIKKLTFLLWLKENFRVKAFDEANQKSGTFKFQAQNSHFAYFLGDGAT